jgi:hypothetical protein
MYRQRALSVLAVFPPPPLPPPTVSPGFKELVNLPIVSGLKIKTSHTFFVAISISHPREFLKACPDLSLPAGFTGVFSYFLARS